MAKMYSVYTSLNYRDVMSYPPGTQKLGFKGGAQTPQLLLTSGFNRNVAQLSADLQYLQT